MYITVQQGDTLQSIAAKYGGSASLADVLASANNLEYPYLVDDPTFQKNAYAAGSVSVTLTQSSAQTLPTGTLFQSIPGNGSETRTYSTTGQITLTAQGQTVAVGVVCTVAGRFGNALPGVVTVPVAASGISVTNPAPISGGVIYRVLVPGDQMLIPGNISAQPNTTSRLSLSDYDTLGGTDLYMTPNGGLQFSTDDLVDISGPNCVGQDIGACIMTPFGSIPDEPSFGTYVPSCIGQAGDYPLQRAAVLSQGAAQADDRIQSAGPISISQQGTFTTIELTATMNTGKSALVSANVSGNGGATQ